MLTSKQEKEILDFIRDQRNEIDQIAEFMYHNTDNQCEFASSYDTDLCRAIGVNPTGKSAAIIAELKRIYKKIAELEGKKFEVKTFYKEHA